MKKNRIWNVIWAVVFCVSLMSGCGSNQTVKNEKYSVVCTIFPEYDWVKEIIGDNADDFELTLLLDNGVDLHSYQPTAADIAKIASCDVFIYVGGESDEWVDDALAEATNKDMQVIDLLEVLGTDVKEEEVVEGMQAEEEEEEEDEEEPEYDEHVWLSLKNAQILAQKIEEAIETVDSKNAEKYRNNLLAYQTKLSDLDMKYQETVKSASKGTLVFGDRFPFRYLVDDYSLKYYAAFVGCSAETEASFETITFLADKMNVLDLSKILVLESSDQKIAQTVVQNTENKNQEILVLDSMQSTTLKAAESYLKIMEKNLEVLKEALE